jgi:thiamine transporter
LNSQNQPIEQSKQQPKSNLIFATKILAEITIFVSLAVALSYLSHFFFNLPQGGSINLGMIPIFWLSLRRGPIVGIFAGLVFGFADFAVEPSSIVNPVQAALDYPLAFAFLGVAGFFRRFSKVGPVLGVAVGGFLRFLLHFTSGVFFFYMFAPEGMNVVLYSAIYNATYMIPSTIICAIFIITLQRSKTLDIYM